MDLVNAIAALAPDGAVSVRCGTSTTGGRVSVGGATFVPSCWVNRPAAAGKPVVLLMAGGMCVAIGDGDGYLPLSGGRMTGTFESSGNPGQMVVRGPGINYPDCKAGGGGNQIGFTWGSPNINVSVDNVVSAVAATVSSAKFKTDVRAVGDAVSTVDELRPVTYLPLDFDGEPPEGAIRHIGLIAEEVAEVVPSAVTNSPTDNTPISVNYAELVPLLTASIQELAARVAALEGGV